MATYKQISAHFSAYEKTRFDSEAALKNAAYELFDRYSDSLNLDEKSWTDDKGGSQPYVQMGLLKEGQFTPKRISFQYGNGTIPRVEFAISLELQPENGSIPDAVAYVELSLVRMKRAFRLTIEPNGSAVDIPIDGDDSRFDYACAAISEKILDAFPFSDFPSP